LDIESIGEDAFAFNGDADTEGVADRHTRVYSLGLTGFLDEYKCGNVYFDYAQFTVTYTWVNYDGEVLQVDESVLYGDLPVYSAPTPTHSDGNTFCGWESNTDSEYNVKMVAQFTDGDLSDVGGNAEDGGTEVEDAMVKAVAIAVTAFILLKSFLKHW
jgi:hypothetical protein